MKKLNITEEELLFRYMTSLDELLDECDWVTNISSEMVCGIIASILIEQNVNVFMPSADLYESYSTHVKGLGLSDEEWRDNYGIPQIINIIYSILETKAK
jgi:hypothetical protein